MERITESPMETNTGDRLLALSKHAFLALLTGGLSLVWLVGRKLPSWWESACLERARWIQDGRKPDAWKWVAEGWKATAGTILVSIPCAMAVTSGASLIVRGTIHPATASLTTAKAYVFLIVTPPILACAICLTLLSTWLWHSGRQAVSLAWSNRPWSH